MRKIVSSMFTTISCGQLRNPGSRDLTKLRLLTISPVSSPPGCNYVCLTQAIYSHLHLTDND